CARGRIYSNFSMDYW
nr:immunoglobulin heavy chain junction region [Mus musculus]MBK4195179.1 immunoglobulin heavy chain junction region [Mus musculus]